MKTAFTIVTGNPGKLAEFKRLLPSGLTFEAVAIDLPEIQSLDSEEIVADKARRAFEIVSKPLIVEDVTAGIDKLNGLPGPFIKFFEQSLGKDALFQLAGETAATITCTIGYFDGTTLLFAKGMVHGRVVSARGESGFGFDFVFMPEGQAKTFAEMEHSEKDALSHRALAVKDLLQQLEQL